MKKTNKLWLALFLALLVTALVVVGMTAAAEETPTVVASGNCGGEHPSDPYLAYSNLQWTLDSNGTLTISGTGRMMEMDFEWVNTAWCPYRNQVKSVVIEPGVTSIGMAAFFNCPVTRAVIPGTVKTIENSAFRGCKLEVLFMENGIETIDVAAFPDDTALTVFFKGNEAQWNQIAIVEEQNDSLLNANIHYNVVDWGYCGGEGDGTNLIWTLDNEETLTISGEGAMKSYAFTSDNRIQFVIMENGVTDIGYSAFSTCASLREVSIPGSVTKIGLFAFEGCASLKSVYIPEGVTIIDDCAFQYCWSLNSVYIPVSVEQIGWESFDLSPLKDVFCAGIRSQHNILFGENNSSLLKAKWHYNVFAGGYCGGEGDGTNLVWVLDNDGTLTISGTGAMKSYLDEMPPWYDYADLIRCVILEDGVTTVGDAAFVGCANLIEATMPDSVERVGMGAFSGCQSLKSIDLSHVTKICHLAFAGCAALNSVNLTVCTDIEDTGFTECTALSQLFLSEPMNLGPYAFYGCPLTDIFYTGSEAQWAQDIADKFNPYYPVTSVPFESIRIHYNVVDWGYCGGDLVWIYDSNDTLTISGQGGTGWYGEYSDGEMNHDTGAPWYPYRERIQTVVLEEGVSQIGVNAFTSCTGLKNVVIPLSLKSVLEVSFWMCGSIENVFYAGDAAQWNQITFWEIGGPGVTGNDDLLNARRHYNAAWHTPGEPVRENEVAATCTTAGSCDEVIHCTQCDYAFSRITVTVDPLNHPNAQTVDAIPSTCKEHGLAAGVYCPDCDTWVSGHEALPLAAHSFGDWAVTQQPTADRTGTETRTCSVCGETETRSIDKLPQPEQPGDGGNNGGFLDTIRDFFQKILDFFKNLFSWMR